VDYLKGLSYLELSKKYGVSEGTLGRILRRIYGKTSMPKKVRQTKKNLPPEVPSGSESLSPEEEIKLLKAELKKKEKKIHDMEYLVEVVGDYLGKDFGLPKKK
jgi:transposase